MKDQIDRLVQGILQDLASPPPSRPEIAQFFELVGVDGKSKARAQRDVLTRWAADGTLGNEERLYAVKQLEGLPVF